MSAPTATSSGTILIVDDEPFILDVMSRLLGDAGYEIHTCYLWSGIANAVRVRQPNLVLLDYNMPGLRGDAICEILKRSAPASGMKIVLFSSEERTNSRTSSRNAAPTATS